MRLETAGLTEAKWLEAYDSANLTAEISAVPVHYKTR